MKISYNGLSCPNCGATKFQLLDGDVFLCEYCDGKFHYDLDNIDLENEKILVEELKLKFQDKVAELYAEKKKNYYFLLECKKLAYPKLLNNIFLIGLIISFFTLLIEGVIPYALTGIAVFSVLLFLAEIRRKKKYLKYEPYIRQYANIVIELQSEIDLYTRLISKLKK